MSQSNLEDIKLSNQLCFALYSANNAVIRAYRPFLDEMNLTYSQFIVMMALWESDNISLKTLAELTLLDPGSLTPILKRLEIKGLVNRSRSRDDERLRILAVTEEGWSVRDRAASVPAKVKGKIGLPKSLLKEIKTHCDAITSHLAHGSGE